MPNFTEGFGSTGSSDSILPQGRGQGEGRPSRGALAFFRRELAAQNWKEDGAVLTSREATLNFSSPEQNAQLTLVHKYDLTFVTLTTQLKESAMAARAKAKREADEKFVRDAEASAKQIIAADEARRVAQAATLSDTPLHAAADQTTPVPVPDNAENIKFDGAEGKLEFDSAASVKALAAFYRGSLSSLGWKEQPSVINKSTMVVMEFSKGGKELSFTAMQMGPKVNVSADGSGLVMANARPDAKGRQTANAAATNAPVEALEAEPDAALPVPKQHTMSSLGSGKLPGSETPFRRELEASVPAELASGAGVLSQRTRKTRLEGIGRARRGEAGSGPARLFVARRAGDAETARSNGETSVNLGAEDPGPRQPPRTSCRSRARPG